MKRFLLDALALVVLAVVGGFLFAWSGLYSVAASRGHLAITAGLLRFGMTNSVETHAWGIEAPPLDDPALIERAAGHFHTGCAPCHGAPGYPPNPITQTLLPEPPDLGEAVPVWQPNHLFWIVKHGLKYASMPAWPTQERDDEVWAIVAFLQRLPEMSPDEYRALAGVKHAEPLEIEPASSAEPLSAASAELFSSDPVSCTRCHGPQGLGSEAGGVPRIAGQKQEYLEMTLEDYASGARPSGVMSPVAAYLDEEERRQIAKYFASLDVGPSANDRSGVSSADMQVLQLGGGLANSGDPSRRIAACEACHGPRGTAAEKDPRYPALAGQHPAYLEQQLTLWRAGNRGGTLSDIMSAAVGNMTDEQIRAVSLYYSRLGAD